MYDLSYSSILEYNLKPLKNDIHIVSSWLLAEQDFANQKHNTYMHIIQATQQPILFHSIRILRLGNFNNIACQYQIVAGVH